MDTEIIKNLAEGHSKQAKGANQYWLALITVSIIIWTGKKEDGLIELPFSLGTATPIDFYFISIVLLSGLTIAFVSSMIQAIRTRMLIQKVLDEIPNSEKYKLGFHMQDYLDSLLGATYNRVAPISQFILGKNQFLPNPNLKTSKKPPLFFRIVGILLYICLRVLTYFFIYAIPLISGNKCFEALVDSSGISSFPIYGWVIFALVTLPLISIAILFIGDLKYTTRVIFKALV